MSREVDRLLANLSSSLGTQPDRERPSRPGAPVSQPISQPRIAVGVARADGPPTRGDHVALWARVLLVAVLAAGWIACGAWRLRSGAAHVVALVLLFSGIVLAAEQTLPRIGYAAERASWRCPAK
jgi:hypothetical protein